MVDTYRLDRQIGQPMFTILGCEAGGMVPQLARMAKSLASQSSPAAALTASPPSTISPRRSRGMSGGRGLLHVGDFDPSGEHMFSALDEDVRAFLKRINPNARIHPERVAILPEHVARFGLQTSPRKATDNRSFEGIGDDPDATVQAEALDPADLAALIEAALRREWDEHAEAEVAAREDEERHRLRAWLAQRPK